MAGICRLNGKIPPRRLSFLRWRKTIPSQCKRFPGNRAFAVPPVIAGGYSGLSAKHDLSWVQIPPRETRS